MDPWIINGIEILWELTLFMIRILTIGEVDRRVKFLTTGPAAPPQWQDLQMESQHARTFHHPTRVGRSTHALVLLDIRISKLTTPCDLITPSDNSRLATNATTLMNRPSVPVKRHVTIALTFLNSKLARLALLLITSQRLGKRRATAFRQVTRLPVMSYVLIKLVVTTACARLDIQATLIRLTLFLRTIEALVLQIGTKDYTSALQEQLRLMQLDAPK
jgi:hypothetical protein